MEKGMGLLEGWKELGDVGKDGWRKVMREGVRQFGIERMAEGGREGRKE